MARAHIIADAQGLPTPKFVNVFDEAWRALSVVGVGEWLQDAFKKSRSYGMQNIVVMHRLSDLDAAGAAGSREVKLAEGLLHDAQTRVVYRQAEDEVPRAREVLGLTSLEAELLPELDPGVALWKVGSRSLTGPASSVPPPLGARFSGRSPTTTSRPSVTFIAAGSRIAVPSASSAAGAPDGRRMTASRKFIEGEPMKPATKRFAGVR